MTHSKPSVALWAMVILLAILGLGSLGGGLWLVTREVFMNRIMQALTFTAGAVALVWIAWPGASTNSATPVNRVYVVGTLVLLAGLPPLVRRYVGPVRQGWGARAARVGGYAVVLAALAALVSRQEDVGSVTAPVVMLMVVPYMLGITLGVQDPTSPVIVWLSFIPFASPIVMPIRVAMGTAPTWEVLVSLAISTALIPVLVWGAGRIYSNAVVRMGARVRLRDALHSV